MDLSTLDPKILKELGEMAIYFEYIERFWWLAIILLVWCMTWKGLALWRAGRNKNVAWFIVLFLVNTLSILEIIYVLGFSKKKK